MKPKVLVVQAIHPAGIEMLKPEVDIIMAKSPDPEQLLQEVADVEGIILRLSPLPASVINAASKLKVIGRPGVGCDNVDIAAAAARGIPVVYSPGSNNISVAEHTVGLMLAVTKRIVDANFAVKAKHNFQFRTEVQTTELYGKTIGIVGYGNIGRRVADICRNGFGMRVLAYDKYLSADTVAAGGARLVEHLDELLSEADVVSMHMPATPDSYHMISGDQLRKMKPSAFLLNTARGTVVDEKALFEALKNKIIAGAGSDVFEQEPPVWDNPLLTLDNYIVTPHMAAHSAESLTRMATMMAEGVLDVFHGRQPKYIAK